MKKGILRRGAALVLAAFAAASAFGQHGGRGDAYAKYGGRDGAKVAAPGQTPMDLNVGDKIRIKGSDLVYTVGPEGLVLPIDVAIEVTRENPVTKKTEVLEVRTRAPRSQHAVGLYPLAIFSIAGQLRLNDNSLQGGTRSIVGSVLSYDAISNLDFGRRFEIGAFFFQPYDSNDGDLYQISARYFFNKQAGFQLAYLNTTEGSGDQDASSFSYHALFDVTAVPAGLVDSRQINARFGIGVLNNLSSEFAISQSNFVKRSTFNFSTFVDLSYNLTPRISLNATEWYVRDRNADLNRFAVGASYKF